MYILLNNTLSHCLKVEAILHQIKQVYFEHFLLYCWYNIQYYTIINLQLHRFIYILTDMRYFFIVQLPLYFLIGNTVKNQSPSLAYQGH